jgi:hypothetical protein
VQLFVVGLTFARHVWATRSGWGNPLFSLLSREGSMVFFAITGQSLHHPKCPMLKVTSRADCNHCGLLGPSRLEPRGIPVRFKFPLEYMHL